MKKFMYLWILFFITACANQPKKEASAEGDLKENETVLENSALENLEEDFVYQHLTRQKLQDYFDLLKLKQEHPKFEKDITLQLIKLSNDSLDISNVNQKVSIENVQLIGQTIKISDSIKKLRVSFDIVVEDSKRSDSITAIISTKKIFLDKKEMISTKVVFEK